MTKNQLIEKLRYNWYMKLLCFIAAILIYVFYRSSLVDTKTFVVPLKIIENGAVMCVEEPKGTIKIVVKTDSEHMSMIHSSEISASINLDNITKSGYVTVPVKLDVSEEYLSYDSFEARAQPESIRVKVERKDVSYIKLNPILIGEPAHGYEVAELFINPEYIQVAGAESILKATEYINTTAIDVSNAKVNFTKEAYPLEINKQLEVIEKGPYSVTVNFVEQKMERTIENIPVYINGLWPDLIVEEPVPTVKVVLDGAVSALESYELGNNTIVVDLSEIQEPGTYELPLNFYFPESFEIKEKSNENITLTVVAAENTEIEQEQQNQNTGNEDNSNLSNKTESSQNASAGADSAETKVSDEATEKTTSTGKKSKSKKGSN